MKALKWMLIAISLPWYLQTLQAANEVIPANDVIRQKTDTKLLQQVTPTGTKEVSVLGNGDILSASEVLGASGNSRLGHINSKYTKNTSDIKHIRQLASKSIDTNNVVEECLKYLRKNSAELAIDPDNLMLHNVIASGRSITAVFFQTYQGIEVRNSLIRLHVSPRGLINTFTSTYFNDIKLESDKPSYSFQTVESAATIGLPSTGYTIKNNNVCVLPCFNGSGYNYKLIYDCDVELPGFELYKAYIDANTGEILYRKNMNMNVNLNVQSRHYGNNPNEALITGPLGLLDFNIDGKTVTSNSSGRVSVDESAIGKQFTTNLKGTYLSMRELLYPASYGTGTEYSYTGVVESDGLKLLDSNNRHELLRTVYNNVMDALTYYYQLDPSTINSYAIYVQMIPDNMSTTSLTYEFNAFASGPNATTLLAANHEKVFMGKLNKVLFHEFGHNVVAKKYHDAGVQTGMFSKLANEANADITSAFILNNPHAFEHIVTPDLLNWANSINLNRTVENNRVYNGTLTGECHEDSQVLSAAFWDFWKNAGTEEATDPVKSIVHLAKELTPDGYTAEELFARWFEALVRKANDWREVDDSGEWAEEEYEHFFMPIYNAFNKHGIGFANLINQKFKHIGVEDIADSTKAVPINCSIEDLAAPKQIEQIYLNYYTNYDGSIKTLPLTVSSPGNYKGEIPALGKPALVHYYFTYDDPFSNSQGQIKINRDFSFFIGYNELYYDNCESDESWEVVYNPNATNGFTNRTPELKFQIEQSPWNHTLYSPGFAAGGDRCWTTTTVCTTTVNSSGDYSYISISLKDTSTIITPSINCKSYKNVYLSYQKYMILRNAGARAGLVVEVSTDNGATWQEVQKIEGAQKPNNWNWNREYINITKAIAATNAFETIKVRFVAYASNNSVGLTVLIDDVKLHGSNSETSIHEDNYIGNIEVAPNPASTEINVKFPYAIFNPELQITNMLGMEVMNVKLNGEINNTQININSLENGVYMIKTLSEGKIYQSKLIIAR